MSEPTCQHCGKTERQHPGIVVEGRYVPFCDAGEHTKFLPQQAGSDSPKVPDDLRERHTLLKAWTDAGKHPRTAHNSFEFDKEIVRLIERIASLEADNTRLREENERLQRELNHAVFMDDKHKAEAKAEVARLKQPVDRAIELFEDLLDCLDTEEFSDTRKEIEALQVEFAARSTGKGDR
jgi:regulator of replication initiation timing